MQHTRQGHLPAAAAIHNSSSSSNNTARQQHTRPVRFWGPHTRIMLHVAHTHTGRHCHTLPHTLVHTHTPHTLSLFIRDCSLQPCVLRATVGGKPKKKKKLVCVGERANNWRIAWPGLNLPATATAPAALHGSCCQRFCRLHCTLIATGRDYPHAAYQCPGGAGARPGLQQTGCYPPTPPAAAFPYAAKNH